MITNTEYKTLDDAYSFFNARLWAGELPECMIVLQRKGKNNLGYFAPSRFEHREDAERTTDEIALNPDNFQDRTDADILSTLVHEMAHLWQMHFGTPSRNGYHNKEWGSEMDRIGLTPSNTGAEGGRRTGQQMHHFVVIGGAFDTAAKEFLRSAALSWNSRKRDNAKKEQSKTKFSCPMCGQNAWAKPTATLICGDCKITMEIN